MKTQIETSFLDNNETAQFPVKPQGRDALKRIFMILGVGVVLFGGGIVGWRHLLDKNNDKPPPPILSRTLEDILKSGRITVITLNNPYCYYQYQDEKKGFEYDLASAFAKYLGVDLSVWVSDSRENLIADLLTGKGDFIAANLVMIPRLMDQIGFSDAYLNVQHQIVTRRGFTPITTPEDLSGKIVHVEQGSGHQADLEVLLSKGIGLQIIPHQILTSDELIGEVEDRDIDITIADHHIAMLNRRYYPKTTISGTINDQEAYRWVFPMESWQLALRINLFFSEILSKGQFLDIYNHYFEDIGFFDYMGIRAFHRRIESRLPGFQHWIEEAASMTGFDWRLLAAQIYQESHFDPEAISQDGAYGLMQITPNTGECFGVKDMMDPEENIRAGVLQLRALYDLYDKAENPDRLFLALSAYNVGQGHMKDARDLARNRNLNPEKWASVAESLLLLEEPDFYQNATYGYCRGAEPVNYVQQIKVYYDILRRQGIVLSKGKSFEVQGL